jgi:hypothetical protein
MTSERSASTVRKDESALTDRTRAEISALQRYGLRWAVLSAWAGELDRQEVEIGAEARKRLETCRVKLASGCFSACEVGCDLGVIEGTLVSRAASETPNAVDSWTALVGRAMAENAELEEFLRIPAVRFQYMHCGFQACRCES